MSDLVAVLGADASQLRSEVKGAKDSLKEYKREASSCGSTQEGLLKAADKAAKSFKACGNSFRDANSSISGLEAKAKELLFRYQSLDKTARKSKLGLSIKLQSIQAVEHLKKLKSKVNEVEGTFNKLSGKTFSFGNLSIPLPKGLEKYKSAIENLINKHPKLASALGSVVTKITGFWGACAAAVTNYIREVERANEAVSKVQTNTGFSRGVSTLVASLSKGITTAYEVSFDEVVRGMQRIMKEYNVSAQVASDYINKALSNGANSRGDYFDNLDEYLIQYKQNGYDLDEATAMFIKEGQNAYKDKLSDTSKELGVRIALMNDTTKKAISTLKLDWKSLQALANSGPEGKKLAINLIVQQVEKLGIESSEALKAISDLSGSMGEDLGAQQFVDSLKLSNEEIQKTVNNESDLQKANEELARSSANLEQAWSTALGNDGGGLQESWILVKVLIYDILTATVNLCSYAGKGARLVWNAVELFIIDPLLCVVDACVIAGNAFKHLFDQDWDAFKQESALAINNMKKHFTNDILDMENTLSDFEEDAGDPIVKEAKIKLEADLSIQQVTLSIGEAVFKATAKFKSLQDQWKSLKTVAEKTSWINANKNAFNELGLSINNVAEAQKAFVTNTEEAIAAIEKQARANAARNLLEKEYEKLLLDLIKLNKLTPSFLGKKPPVGSNLLPWLLDALGNVNAMGNTVLQNNWRSLQLIKESPTIALLKSFILDAGTSLYTPETKVGGGTGNTPKKTLEVEIKAGSLKDLQEKLRTLIASKEAGTFEGTQSEYLVQKDVLQKNIDKLLKEVDASLSSAVREAEDIFSQNQRDSITLTVETLERPDPLNQDFSNGLRGSLEEISYWESDSANKILAKAKEFDKKALDVSNTIEEIKDVLSNSEAGKKYLNMLIQIRNLYKTSAEGLKAMASAYNSFSESTLFEAEKLYDKEFDSKLAKGTPEERLGLKASLMMSSSPYREGEHRQNIAKAITILMLSKGVDVTKYQELNAKKKAGINLDDAESSLLADYMAKETEATNNVSDYISALITVLNGKKTPESIANLNRAKEALNSEAIAPAEKAATFLDANIGSENATNKLLKTSEILQNAAVDFQEAINVKEVDNSKVGKATSLYEADRMELSNVAINIADLLSLFEIALNKEELNIPLTVDDEKVIALMKELLDKYGALTIKIDADVSAVKKAVSEKNLTEKKQAAFDVTLSGASDTVNTIGSIYDSWKDLNETMKDKDGFLQVIIGFQTVIQTILGVMSVIKTIQSVIQVFEALSTANAQKEVANKNQEAAASMSNAGAKSAEALASATASGSSLPFPANVAAIAIAVAAVVGALAMIGSMAFASGGIVGGGTSIGDYNLARVNSGEMILNGTLQKRLFNILNGKDSMNNVILNGNVDFRLRGRDLIGSINNENKRMSRL